MRRIFVNGTFDILHVGHIRMLNYARSLGDTLTVAIDTDRRVKQLKGIDRPINSDCIRREMLYALRAVDFVHIFDTDQELIRLINEHDIMVKGADYRNKEIIGSELIEIDFYNIVYGQSTTKTIQNIINRR